GAAAVRAHRRPGREVSEKALEIPLLLMDDRLDDDLAEWKRDRAVLLLHPAALRRPIALDARAEPFGDCRDLRVGDRPMVGPYRDHALRHEHPLRLGVEAIEVEPVHRLRD